MNENNDIDRILVVGAGNIGSAMARGILNGGRTLAIYNRTPSRLKRFAGFRDVTPFTDLGRALSEYEPDMVVICVEGHALKEVIDKMGPYIADKKATVVSCAAAGTLDELASMLKPYTSVPKIIRILPNIAAEAGESVNLVCSLNISEEELEQAEELFRATGSWHVIDERLFKPAMALSSCGTAYALRYIRATVQGAVELGLSPDLATEISALTLAGTARLLVSSGSHPEDLVDRVTTPGGVTIRGLNAMEEGGFTPSVIAGIKAINK